MERKWPDLCETLLGKLEAAGVDTTEERGEFAVLYAECCAGVMPETHTTALKAMDLCQIEILHGHAGESEE